MSSWYMSSRRRRIATNTATVSPNTTTNTPPPGPRTRAIAVHLDEAVAQLLYRLRSESQPSGASLEQEVLEPASEHADPTPETDASRSSRLPGPHGSPQPAEAAAPSGTASSKTASELASTERIAVSSTPETHPWQDPNATSLAGRTANDSTGEDVGKCYMCTHGQKPLSAGSTNNNNNNNINDMMVQSPSPSIRKLMDAAQKLREESALVAFPSETVYGLGGNGLDPQGIANIYKAKGRPSDNPLILHISSLGMLKTLLPKDYTIPSHIKTLMDTFWPGPLTLLLPRGLNVPKKVTGGSDVMAVRMPSHPIALLLIAAANVPIAAPSANRSGRPSPTTAKHVLDDLDGKIEYIITLQPRIVKNLDKEENESGEQSENNLNEEESTSSGKKKKSKKNRKKHDADAEEILESPILEPFKRDLSELTKEYSKILNSPEKSKSVSKYERMLAEVLVNDREKLFVKPKADSIAGVESTVLDVMRDPPVILRPGSVTQFDLQSIKGFENVKVYRAGTKSKDTKTETNDDKYASDEKENTLIDSKLQKEQEETPTTPGMKYRHYSPDCEVQLIEFGHNILSDVIDDLSEVRKQILAKNVKEIDTVEDKNLLNSINEVKSKMNKYEEDFKLTSRKKIIETIIRSYKRSIASPETSGIPIAYFTTFSTPSVCYPSTESKTLATLKVKPKNQIFEPYIPSMYVDLYLEVRSILMETNSYVNELDIKPSRFVPQEKIIKELDPDVAMDIAMIYKRAPIYHRPLGWYKPRTVDNSDGVDPCQGPNKFLFTALRTMEKLKVSTIVVEGVWDIDSGSAFMNRVRKAANEVALV